MFVVDSNRCRWVTKIQQYLIKLINLISFRKWIELSTWYNISPPKAFTDIDRSILVVPVLPRFVLSVITGASCIEYFLLCFVYSKSSMSKVFLLHYHADYLLHSMHTKYNIRSYLYDLHTR